MNNEKNIFSDTYEIIGYLQSGSGGAVYKAYHKRLKKEVVLKRIKRKYEDQQTRSRYIEKSESFIFTTSIRFFEC